MPFDLSLDYLLGMAAWLAAGAVTFVLLLKFRRRWQTQKPARIRWANLGLSLWMFLAALTLVELYFAVIYDQSDSFNMTNVSKHWFTRHVRVNNEGFRDARPFPKEVPAGMRRVCFIGDSFTFGHGIKNVADRFSDITAANLERKQPGEFLVSNIGEAGIDLLLVDNLVRKSVESGYRIDVLVYVLCLNDIEGFDPRSQETYKKFGLYGSNLFLFRDTYFLNLLHYRVQQARLPEIRDYYSHIQEFYRAGAWDRMRTKFDDFHDFCREHDIDLRVAVFPFLHNLGPDYPFDAAHERIVEFCKEQDISCLDLKPVLLPHVAEGLTVNRFDAHPNERAHRLAAEAIERDLLPDLFSGNGKGPD